MSTPELLDYYQEYLELQPSLFRESDNLHLLFQSIFHAYDLQQQDFLWLSQNILNIDLAEKSHLDFIGMLVGQDRFLIGFNAETYFGFEGSYKSDTFGMSGAPYIGGYWNSRSYFNSATARRLNDDEYRRIIKARVIPLLYSVHMLTSNKTHYYHCQSFIIMKTKRQKNLLPSCPSQLLHTKPLHQHVYKCNNSIQNCIY